MSRTGGSAQSQVSAKGAQLHLEETLAMQEQGHAK